jgi:hypothetical protein
MTRPPQTKQQLVQSLQKRREIKVVLMDQGSPADLSRSIKALKQKRITVIAIEEP